MTKTAPAAAAQFLAARAIAGVLAAGSVLGIAELLAVIFGPESSPFFAVGSAAIDLTPDGVREWAIQTFGTNDKFALFVGMSVAIAAISALAGLLEREKRPIGTAMFAAFGVAGIVAVLTRAQASAMDAVPTLVGAFAGIALLRTLTRLADEARTSTPETNGVPRRRFLTIALTSAAVAAAGAVAGRVLNSKLRDVIADRNNFTVPRAAIPPPPTPPGPSTTFGGTTPFITPNSDFYRIDTALQVPRLTAADWSLTIHGMVDREITLTMEDLRARPALERIVTLTCVSNSIGGDLIGNASWTGYPIKDLLGLAGVHPDADMLLSTSVDGFTAGTPVETVTDGRDAILAVGMNGEPLPLEHGYPVRMVVPGLYGYVSATKWVTDWELTRFDQTKAYWTKRGWSARGPIKTGSRIDVPRSSADPAPGAVTVAGVAWAQHRGIRAVEVRVDDGPWQSATLDEEVSVDTWRLWTWQWQAESGRHTLTVRATDANGVVQTEQRADPVPDGATGRHSVSVRVG